MHVMKNSERSFYIKLYTVIVLCGAVSACLLFLVFTGGAAGIENSLASSESEVPAASAELPTALPEESSTPQPLPSATPDTVSDDSILRIVNGSHRLDPSYVPSDLTVPSVTSEGTEYLRSEAAAAIEKLFAAAKEAGYDLVLISGYRSYEFEVRNQQYYIGMYGAEYAAHVDCNPGANEHQLGLAADIGTTDGVCRLENCFASGGASAWLQENAWKYGWILRYPDGKQDITGIMYSPWNYRYVGIEAAGELHASGLTMEEYYGMNGN